MSDFETLFTGLDRAYGKYTTTGGLDSKGKAEGRAVTEAKPVTPELYSKHLRGEQGLGIIPIMDNQRCWWGAADIDEYDGLDLKKLNAECRQLSLPLVLCRSKSGGAHLYTFFTSPIEAATVRDRLQIMASALGYPSVEIFPKQREIAADGVGNWLNLPYFNEKGPTNRYALDADGKALPTVEAFVAHARSMAVDEKTFVSLDVKPLEKPFMDGPPCLQKLAAQPEGKGFAGARNNGLFNMGVYLRQKYPDDWKAKLSEYNVAHMQPPLPAGEVTVLERSLSKEKYFYKCNDAPIKSVCARSDCLGRKYGIGDGDGSDVETVLGDLKRTQTKDVYGNVVVDADVTWFWTIGGIDLPMSTAEVNDQKSVRYKVQERLGKHFKPVPGGRWQSILAEKIPAADIIEVSMADTYAGEVYEMLTDFCTAHGGAENKIEIDTGMVWRDDDGYLWFGPKHFWKFVCHRGFARPNQNREKKKMYRVMVKHLRCTKKALRLSSERITECWRVMDWVDADVEQQAPPRSEGSMF